MKSKTIKLSEIAKCKNFSLSPDHWIPGHKTEECVPEQRIKLAKFEEKEIENKKAEIEEVKTKSNVRIEKYKERLRQD